MSDEAHRGFTTRAVHTARPEPIAERPLAPPIYQTATFAFDDMDAFAGMAQRKIEGGYLYSRWGNPTVDGFARTVSALEGTEATACFGSGMAAITGALLSVCRAGDHIVATAQLYGGTYGLLSAVAPRLGIEVTFVPAGDHEAAAAAFRPQTKVLYTETIGNPNVPVADVAALAAIAHDRGALLVVDATLTPPSIMRPAEHGADLVVHSATKFLSGHTDVTGGVVSGSAERIATVRHFLLETGAILAPFEAWLALRGMKTLALRTQRICANAAAVAAALESHPGIERVLYPGLASHPDHAVAVRQLDGGFGGMIAAVVAGGAEGGRRMLERIRIVSPAASLGGVHSLMVHPASVTHTQLGPAELEAAGIPPGMVRISVGIEDAEDLIEDLTQAVDG